MAAGLKDVSLSCLLVAVFLNSPSSSSVVERLSKGSSQESRLTRSDDDSVDVVALQTLVQQRASVIQSLQSDLQSEKNRVDAIQSEVSALKNRLAVTSKAVAFSARFGHDGGPSVGVPLGQHSTLVFDKVVLNVGDGYDPHTGIFTAPVSGVYSFFLTQMSSDGARELWLSIRQDGSSLDSVYSEGEGDTHDQGATQVTAHLQVGQKVWVRQEIGSGVRGGSFTVFTGYLLQAD